MKKVTRRQRRRLLRKNLEKPVNAVKTLSAPASEDPATTEEEVPNAGDDALSFQEGTSRRALRYQPHRSKGVQFLDTRRVTYQVTPKGELRAVNKPRSRVKRLREEKRHQERQSRRSKQKETDQGNAST